MKRINVNTQQTHFIGCWNLENNKLCNEITDFFQNNKDLQKQGLTASGKDLKKKSRIDITVSPNDLKKPKFEIIKKYVNELHKCFLDCQNQWPFLKSILKKVAATTFNSITVDGDTSTNDMVGIFSTGKAKNSKIYNVLDPKLQDFEKALHRLCLNLAKQIVVDGEGAKKFITVNVTGARSAAMAKKVGFSIANSPLVKTAIGGGDPNWGRIIMGIGKSGEMIDTKKLKIKLGDFMVAENGRVWVDGDSDGIAFMRTVLDLVRNEGHMATFNASLEALIEERRNA